jgi:hypothetical protein
MTYEELRKKALLYADLHPDSTISLEGACDSLHFRQMFFPFALAHMLVAYIEEHKASVENKT